MTAMCCPHTCPDGLDNLSTCGCSVPEELGSPNFKSIWIPLKRVPSQYCKLISLYLIKINEKIYISFTKKKKKRKKGTISVCYVKAHCEESLRRVLNPVRFPFPSSDQLPPSLYMPQQDQFKLIKIWKMIWLFSVRNREAIIIFTKWVKPNSYIVNKYISL